MRAVLENFTAADEIAVLRTGQSNSRPWGHRNREGFVAAPHLALRAPGQDLTILAMVSSEPGSPHGAIASTSVVTVSEALQSDEWKNGELRLVQHEHGDSTTSTLRHGHAKVLSNTTVTTNNTHASLGGTLAFDLTLDTIYWPSHGRKPGSQVQFDSDGTLPGLTAGVVYFVRDVALHTFKVSLDPHGTAVNLAGGSLPAPTEPIPFPAHRITARPYLYVEWRGLFQSPVTVTFSNGGGFLQVDWAAHSISARRLTQGSTASFTGGVLPTGVPSGQQLYIVLPADGFAFLSLTYGGTPLLFVDAGSGTITGTPEMLANVSGYVHLHDRFNSYDNAPVVTPYQPIAPGPYPAGVPVVPGFALAADVISYADAAIVLPFAWNEGIEGYGGSGTCTVSGLVCTITAGGPFWDNIFADGYARVGAAKGKVATSNEAAGIFTLESWTPAAGPGAGTHNFEIHLPHWRNNPHHHTAGEGFLYPSSDMQPGGASSLSIGVTYSRPRSQFTGSYVGRQLQNAACSTAINATGVARCTTNASAQITASIVAGPLLRLARADNTSNPANGLIQFEAFLRNGYIVALAGMGQTPSVNGNWRVTAMGHTYGAVGSFVDLEQLSGTDPAVPASVSGAVPLGATITRLYWEPQHRFGGLLETLWRMSVSLGRRVIGVHLGINSSGQIAAATNNQFGFQGQIGWRDDDDSLDWTPGNPDGNAARLHRLATFIAPRAITATYGSSKRLRYIAVDIWQAEADALSPAGRELAERSIPTFADWLCGAIEAAGLSPYPTGAKIPLHWAQVSRIPYELSGTVTEYPGFVFTGDSGGLVNKAISRMVALRGFAASVDTNSSPKLDGTTFFGSDPLHFNGSGEALNGKNAAAAMLSLIEYAFLFALGKGAIAVANQAAGIVGEAATVTALEPPNTGLLASLCAQFFVPARDEVLQRHPWSFATRRITPVAINTTTSTWLYAYAVPPDLLNVTGVFDPAAASDTQIGALLSASLGTTPVGPVDPASQPYRLETDSLGNRVLRTNQPNAVVRYTAKNVDIDVYDPLVRQAVAYRLAHHLAGPVLKGKAGASLAERCLELSEALISQAAAQNFQFHQDTRIERKADWLP